MAEDRCPDCNAPVSGGREGCQGLMDAIRLKILQNPAFGASYNLGFDAYCMQHPEKYGLSAKSYAAHLTRLCCGVERGGEESIYRAINHWLSTNPAISKPELLIKRGDLTVVDIGDLADPAKHNQRVHVWAANVWEAYAPQHDLARQWIDIALGLRARR